MKHFLCAILLLAAASPLAAQLYHPGEQLFYRVSYKAKMFPNTEVGAVEVKTTEDTADGQTYYKVEGIGRTLPTYRWFFNLRSASAEDFHVGEPATLQMVLQDTVRHLHYRYLGRENKKIRNMGRFRTLKFECQLGTTEGYSFTDGTIFTIWISDDENKIPLYIESPVKIGSINAYISGYKGLKYPVESLMK